MTDNNEAKPADGGCHALAEFHVPDCCDSQCRCRIAPQPVTAEDAARPITIDDALEVIHKTYWDNADELWNRGAKESFRAIIQRAIDSATAEAKFSESAALEECARYLHKVRALEAEIKANQEWKRVAKDAEAEVKRLREQLAERKAR